LILPALLRERGLTGRDAAFATELLAGTCRWQGSYDVIIAAAAGRPLSEFQPAVVDLLRLGVHQILSMRVPVPAAVAASVDLAAATVGERVTGLTNAVLRRVAERPLDEWLDHQSEGRDEHDRLALRTAHPRWIVDAYAELLPKSELQQALAANNSSPDVSLAIRPGLAEPSDLVGAGAELSRYSPLAGGEILPSFDWSVTAEPASRTRAPSWLPGRSPSWRLSPAGGSTCVPDRVANPPC
jgi:16S rRNA (cytosine967-C5)-methyltransferase